jgi:hypothetical protein
VSTDLRSSTLMRRRNGTSARFVSIEVVMLMLVLRTSGGRHVGSRR